MGSLPVPKAAWDQNREDRTQSEQCCQLAAAAIDPEDCPLRGLRRPRPNPDLKTNRIDRRSVDVQPTSVPACAAPCPTTPRWPGSGRFHFTSGRFQVASKALFFDPDIFVIFVYRLIWSNEGAAS